MLQWIDDFLFYARNENELLLNLKWFFRVCQEIGLKIHAEKTTLFAREVQFCGRIISADRLQYHPRHYESVIAMRTRVRTLAQIGCEIQFRPTPSASLHYTNYWKHFTRGLEKEQNAPCGIFHSATHGAPHMIPLSLTLNSK